MPRRAAFNCSAVMCSGMTRRTKGNQVLLAIITETTTKCLVVHFKIRHGAANSGISNRLDVVLADGRLRKTRDGVAVEDSLLRFHLLQAVQEPDPGD